MVLKIAHRGASNYAPENSIEAFTKAIEMKVDVVEFDIHSTKDGELIVMHDFEVDRTTDGSGMIKDLNFEELRKFRGLNGEIIHTLQEILDILKDKCICKIDVKVKGMEEELINIIKKNNILNSVIITCRIISVLRKLKQICPDVKIELGGFGHKNIDKMIKKAKSVNADIISPYYTIATKELIEVAHENEFEVHVWTVDDEITIEKMKNLGVDGITSNYPDRI